MKSVVCLIEKKIDSSLLKELKRGGKARQYTMKENVAEGSKDDYPLWQADKFPIS